MGDAIQFSNAQLLAGPQVLSDGSAFPSSVSTVSLALQPPIKGFVTTTGVQLYNLSSPSSPMAIPGIGSNGPVTQAHTLHVRSQSPLQVLVTYLNDATAHTSYTLGELLIEADPAHPIVAVSIQGSGPVEVLAVGNQ